MERGHSPLEDFCVEIAGRTIQGVKVMRCHCMHCNADIGDAFAYAIGYPFCGMLHAGCVAEFDFTRRWHHPRLACEYLARGL